MTSSTFLRRGLSSRGTKVGGFALLFLAAMTLRATAMPTPVGLWVQVDDRSGKQRSLVRIDESADVLSGAVEKVFPNPGEDPFPRCGKCEDARKDQPIVGMVFLKGLKRESTSSLVWSDGKILDPESGNVYSCKITLSADGQTLHVRGYVGTSLIGRTQIWRRAPKSP